MLPHRADMRDALSNVRIGSAKCLHVLDRRFVTRAVRVLLPLWQLPTSKSNFGTTTGFGFAQSSTSDTREAAIGTIRSRSTSNGSYVDKRRNQRHHNADCHCDRAPINAQEK
jgi:hypothetical protein